MEEWFDANRKSAMISQPVVRVSDVTANHLPQRFILGGCCKRLINIEQDQGAVPVKGVRVVDAQVLEEVGAIILLGFRVEKLVHHAFRETSEDITAKKRT